MKTYSWTELQRKMTPERKAAVNAEVRKSMAEMLLAELRNSGPVDVAKFSEAVGISDLEEIDGQDPLDPAVLQDILTALGGSFGTMLHLPHGDIVVSQPEASSTAAKPRHSAKRPMKKTMRQHS